MKDSAEVNELHSCLGEIKSIYTAICKKGWWHLEPNSAWQMFDQSDVGMSDRWFGPGAVKVCISDPTAAWQVSVSAVNWPKCRFWLWVEVWAWGNNVVVKGLIIYLMTPQRLLSVKNAKFTSLTGRGPCIETWKLAKLFKLRFNFCLFANFSTATK